MRPGRRDADGVEAFAVAQIEGVEKGARGDQTADCVVGDVDAAEVDDLEGGEGVGAGGEGVGEVDADEAEREAGEVGVAQREPELVEAGEEVVHAVDLQVLHGAGDGEVEAAAEVLGLERADAEGEGEPLEAPPPAPL